MPDKCKIVPKQEKTTVDDISGQLLNYNNTWMKKIKYYL